MSNNSSLTPPPPHHHRSKEDELMVITPAVKKFALCAALNSCNLGFDIGVNTGTADLIQSSLSLSDTQLEVFIGSINLFGMIGAFGASYVSDRYGRRQTFRLAAYGFILGVFITAVSQSYVSLIIGRVFVGIGVGSGLAIDPLYISEISPAIHRGNLVTWSEIAINLGIVLGFLSLLAYSSIEDDIQWRLMVLTGAILPIVMIYLSKYVMPESPRWLVAQGQFVEAKEVLTELYPSGFDVSEIIEEIKESIDEERLVEKNVGWDAILSPSPAVKRMVIVGVGSAIAQQICGIDAIQYYLVEILKDSGVEDTNERAGWLILFSILKFSFLFVAAYCFDKKGRKPMFLFSLSGMVFSLLMLSLNFYSSANSGITITGIAFYMSFFSIGLGPGAWLIPSEVFFTNIRAKSMSIATLFNRVFAAIMASTVLTADNTIGWGSYFLLLAVLCVICLTKGKHLEEMAHYFAEITGDQSVLELVSKKEDNSSSVPATETGELT